MQKLITIATILMFQFSLSDTAMAQTTIAGDSGLDRTIPTPRLSEGTVNLSGDGVWNIPYIRNFADRIIHEGENAAVPFLPWTRAMHEYKQSNYVAYDPEGLGLPPGGPRSMATPYPAELIQLRDRIIIIFEGGGHVWREIQMDRR